ncbi:Hypothetical protein FKW44_010913, partial [Caligus rogercresseyi]
SFFESSKGSSLLLDTSLWKQSFEDKIPHSSEEDEETKNFVNLDYSTLSHQTQIPTGELIVGSTQNTANTTQQEGPNTKSEALGSLFGQQSVLDDS